MAYAIASEAVAGVRAIPYEGVPALFEEKQQLFLAAIQKWPDHLRAAQRPFGRNARKSVQAAASDQTHQHGFCLVVPRMGRRYLIEFKAAAK